MFKDKFYEDMDEISKMIEPYQYSVNEDLSKFPDEVVVDPEDLESPWGISTKDVLRKHARILGLDSLVNKSYDMANDFFEFKIIDEFGEEVEETTLNFKDNVLSDRIVMVKKKIAYDDSDVEKIAKQTILEGLTFNSWLYRDLDPSRFNEIADLFNDKDTKKQRSVRKKSYSFRIHMANLIDSKKVDIRDIDLCTKFASWILLYIKDGNLAALNNVTRLKIMTHQNKPIYSMEEKEVK
jgi:hypothetical protein